MRFLILIFVLGFTTFQVHALEAQQAQKWLERMSDAIRNLNFNTSFVVVQNNGAEPYRWLHGKDEDGSEYEILSQLNGPRHDIARKNAIVSYLEPNVSPYSIASTSISGPIPVAFSRNISLLAESYHFVPVGRSRILGRVAQVIRIVSKDSHRYGHWLWLDEESGLILKAALVTKQGQMLEQIQFTHLEITPEMAEPLVQLKNTELPNISELSVAEQKVNFDWSPQWMPLGFSLIRSDRHNLPITNQPVEFMLFNDGLVDVSLYVSPSELAQRNVEYVQEGATVILTMVRQNQEISVVGQIPSATAKVIADSISLIKQ